MTQSELLYTLNTAVTKNTYTTEAAFTGVAGTNPVCSQPAGYFAINNPNPVGRSLYLKAFGTIANTAAATFAVNLGFDTAAGTKANSITVYAATAPTAATTALWTLEAWYTCTAFTTSAMNLQVNGVWTQSATASGAVLAATGLRTDFQGAITAVDPRVQFYQELFGTWSASSASNTTTVQQMFLWGLN
jgi:hypothetical protein